MICCPSSEDTVQPVRIQFFYKDLVEDSCVVGVSEVVTWTLYILCIQLYILFLATLVALHFTPVSK